MSNLEKQYKINKWWDSFIRDEWGNLIECEWNNIIKEEIEKIKNE